MPGFASAGNRTMPPCHCSVRGLRSGGISKLACAPGCRRMTSAAGGSDVNVSPVAIDSLSDAENAERSRAIDQANFSQPSSATTGPSKTIMAATMRLKRSIARLLLRQTRRGKTMLGEHALTFRRENEQRKLIRRHRSAVHHGQSVIGTDRERIGELHDLLRGIFLLRGERIGAVGQKD